MACIFLILSVILVFKDVQCLQPYQYLARKCNTKSWGQEKWNDLAMTTIRMMANGMNIRKSEYNKAHRIPYKEIKKWIVDKFPAFWEEYDPKIRRWKADIYDVMYDIHSVDKEYFGYKLLADKRGFEKLTNLNLAHCEAYLAQIPESNKKNGGIDGHRLAEQIDYLCHCMYNAPGNIRPGYPETNHDIGDYYDPMLKRHPKQHEEVTMDDLTTDSINIKKKYGQHYKINENGIYSSDQESV